ncbi:sigma-70 family RNA polymerase sigma factor [Peptoniphilus sp. KCTC 25270]|uniref:sigma-70 family RNA polymerase sigma factor n=1 Tax=Peptoniphilus sp. KCTC 25270 TaxID=2897414 RepID=UPI001E5CF24D|nr:sigma-70 family RNA polymerase sigma factor [Peptoniphilus sp. KCTC 25270]MCD1147832.1 sigma-70 family RNA polymerase sigma factor [Peptoniphilus sp. KCTC 25270]
MMKKDLKNKIESWLVTLGYSFSRELYSKVAKMSFYHPSYKAIADTVLNSIKIANPDLNANEAWSYTRNFVNGMKGNLITNNNYFQSVLKGGLYNWVSNEQDNDIQLISSENDFEKNSFTYLKNIWISNGKGNKIFDFILLINGFPLILIKVIDKDELSFESAFIGLEADFEEFPMFFNFNKLILLTDGDTYKMGSIFDFPEEYLTFETRSINPSEEDYYSFEQLGEMLLSQNILDFLKTNKNSSQIIEYMKNKSKKIEELEGPTGQGLDLENRIMGKEKELGKDKKEDIKVYEKDEELNFLAEFFNPDLEEVLESDDFKKRLEKTKEVPDFKENKSYIEDFQKNNDMNTLETLIKANERLILKEANKFIRYQTTSMDFDDMYQLGYIGLLKAVERFDLEMENEFSTYATYWIRQSITRGINDSSLLVRIPVHRWDSLANLRKLEYKSEEKFNKVDYDWISKELDLSKEKVMELVMIRNTFMNNVSLDTPVGIDENTRLGEFIADEDYSVEEIITSMDLRNSLEEILNILDGRSKDVIIKRFGLNGQEPMTLEEIGEIYNLTRERVRQIESKALKKLRHPSRTKKIKVYCEG